MSSITEKGGSLLLSNRKKNKGDYCTCVWKDGKFYLDQTADLQLATPNRYVSDNDINNQGLPMTKLMWGNYPGMFYFICVDEASQLMVADRLVVRSITWNAMQELIAKPIYAESTTFNLVNLTYDQYKTYLTNGGYDYSVWNALGDYPLMNGSISSYWDNEIALQWCQDAPNADGKARTIGRFDLQTYSATAHFIEKLGHRDPWDTHNIYQSITTPYDRHYYGGTSIFDYFCYRPCIVPATTRYIAYNDQTLWSYK